MKIDTTGPLFYLEHMQVDFTPEQEEQLSLVAAHAGKNTEQLVRDVTLRFLDEDRRFRAGVKRGIEQADRGEFVEEEEMDARVAVWTAT